MLRSAIAAVRRRRLRSAAGVLALCGAVIIGVTNGWAVPGARSVNGHFTSAAVSGTACTSPVGVCTEGILTGSLKGSFSFTATSLTPSADTPTTSVILYTADVTIQAKDGDVSCKDAGALRTTGSGEISSICTIVAGTGAYSGATGTLQFTGTFTASSGGSGDYIGSLTLP